MFTPDLTSDDLLVRFSTGSNFFDHQIYVVFGIHTSAMSNPSEVRLLRDELARAIRGQKEE